MSIQEVKGKGGIPEYPSRKRMGQAEGFQESLMQNLASKQRQSEEAGAARAEGQLGRNDRETNAALLGALSGVRVSAAMQREAVQPAEVRHMSYEESDNVEIAVTEGYTLKGRMDGDRVYVEAKYEDGRLEAYRVDTSMVSVETTHRIERFALETADGVSG